ncbi:MAG: FHA domain-containing protein, partial [Thermoanaerobaculia bacterium]
KNEIQEAMESSKVAVLLVSANFLTSKFILDVEVPRLLKRRDREGLQIVPLIIKPCCWDRVGWLEAMNMYPRDARPLSGGSDHEIDQQLAEFAAIIHEQLDKAPRAPARPQSPAAIEPVSGLRTAPEGSVEEAASAEETAAGGAAAVRLRVIGGGAGSDATAPSETFLFRQPRIAIGRDPGCDLPLADEMRVVSGEHAEIVADGARLLLTDLGSKNFTYLNEEQLEPDRPYEIRPGDVIEIGEYKIRVVAIRGKQAAAAVEPTAFDPGYVNPFQNDGKLLADTLRRVAEAYDQEAPTRRDAALREVLTQALGADGDHPALEIIGRVLGGEGGRHS